MFNFILFCFNYSNGKMRNSELHHSYGNGFVKKTVLDDYGSHTQAHNYYTFHSHSLYEPMQIFGLASGRSIC